MADLRDYDLLKISDDQSYAPPPRRPIGSWIVLSVLVVAAAIAGYVVFGGRKPAAPATAQTEAGKTPPVASAPLGSDAAAIDVPPLSESDPVVRELMKQLTSHPRVAAWLTTDNLIRNFVVVTSMAADGKTPSRQLGVLRPSSAFAVVERGNAFYVDPKSYARYDGMAGAVASIDPAGAARLYATLKPRIEEAYSELGVQVSFDRTLERAIVELLKTPAIEDPVRLEPLGGTAYAFANPQLEKLTAAQKHLLRAGPRNARTIQSSLRAIARALGIPAERLPAEHVARD
ncbi:MAG: DUF3014 domain-containing protein [Vicinamibacterales bacterium]